MSPLLESRPNDCLPLSFDLAQSEYPLFDMFSRQSTQRETYRGSRGIHG